MSYLHPSIQAVHPLRRSSGLAFVVAVHIAAIVAIKSGLSISNVLNGSMPPARIVPTFEKPALPPPPIDTFVPKTPTMTTMVFETPTLPHDPVINETARAETPNTSANSDGMLSGKDTREPAIVIARVDPAHPLTQPMYPTASRRNNEQGRVELMLYILANGKVGEAQVAQSSGHARLDDSALREALKSWRFIPQQENGIAVASWQRFAISFNLRN